MLTTEQVTQLLTCALVLKRWLDSEGIEAPPEVVPGLQLVEQILPEKVRG